MSSVGYWLIRVAIQQLSHPRLSLLIFLNVSHECNRQSSESAEEATQTASETGFVSEALPTAGSTFAAPTSLKRRKVIEI